MNRTIYAPSEDFLEEAQKFAKNGSISITIGECEAFKDLDFDRSKVQLVTVPTNKYIEYLKKVKVHHTQCIDYIDEWTTMNSSAVCYCYSNSLSYSISNKPLILEKNCIKFKFRLPKSGEYNFSIEINNKKYEEGSFLVYD